MPGYVMTYEVIVKLYIIITYYSQITMDCFIFYGFTVKLIVSYIMNSLCCLNISEYLTVIWDIAKLIQGSTRKL